MYVRHNIASYHTRLQRIVIQAIYSFLEPPATLYWLVTTLKVYCMLFDEEYVKLGNISLTAQSIKRQNEKQK